MTVSQRRIMYDNRIRLYSSFFERSRVFLHFHKNVSLYIVSVRASFRTFAGRVHSSISIRRGEGRFKDGCLKPITQNPLCIHFEYHAPHDFSSLLQLSCEKCSSVPALISWRVPGTLQDGCLAPVTQNRRVRMQPWHPLWRRLTVCVTLMVCKTLILLHKSKFNSS